LTTIGAPAQWAGLIDSMVPDILKLIVATWEEMPSPKSDDREDDITDALCRALQQNRTARQLMFQIRTQVVELEPAEGEDLGRMDIAFIFLVPREDIYFCLESKKLNVLKDGVTRSYASEYVTFGMLRFVSGQYAKSVRHGAMVGYVLDGDVARAIANVQANVTANATILCMSSPGLLSPSTIRTTDPRAKETTHLRPHDGLPFLLHHLFMPAAKVDMNRDA
jgi:hypothetical protein